MINTQRKLDIQMQIINQMERMMDLISKVMKKMEIIEIEFKLMKLRIDNGFTEDEEDLISDIFHCWFEDMTEELVNCTIYDIIGGLKEELCERIRHGYGDYLENKLLSKLHTPSISMLCKIDEMYVDIRGVYYK